jgi:hypothetical protein
VNKNEIEAGAVYLSASIGVLERFLYIASLLAGHAEFIGVWLLIKVAGGWKGWSEDHQGVSGRNIFNASLITTALSLIWALWGAATVVWIQFGRTSYAVAAGLGLLVGTYGSWLALALWWRAKVAKRAA